jgi:DNA repair exonuclease SbcCD ATPase subunit
MKLTSLKLVNFRCFQKAEFDLSADVIAICGRNGVGKTAVFDAIEFALLGSIARYTRKPSPPDYLPCRFGSGGVSVRVGLSNQAPQWLEMNRAKGRNARWQLTGSGGWSAHADFLFDFLLDPELSPARRQTETAADYIRSTLILSQHSIRQLVEAEAAERTTTFAFLAGAGAVHRRWEKAEAVLAEAKRKERNEQLRADEAKQVAEELARISAEQEGRVAAIRSQLVDQQITHESFSKALQNAGISVELPPNAEEADSISALIRGVCSERIVLCETRLNSLAEVGAMSESHASRLRQSRQLLVDITNAQSRQQALLAEEKAATERLQALEREIGELEPHISKLKVSVNSLKALQDLQNTHVELVRTLAIAEQEQQRINNELITFRGSIEGLDSDLKSIPSNDVACAQRAERVRSELLNLSTLSQVIPGYSNLLSTVVDQTVRRHALDKAIAALLPDKAALEVQLNSVEQRTGELGRLVAQGKASVDEVTGLAIRLRQLATAKECPLCGHAHASVPALQTAIDQRLSQVPEDLKKASDDFESSSKQQAKLAALVADNRQRLQAWQASLQEAHQERDGAVRMIGGALEQKNHTVAETKRKLLAVEAQIRAVQIQGPQQLTAHDLPGRLHADQSQLAVLEGRRADKAGLREGVRNQATSVSNERLAVEKSLAQYQELVTRLTAEIQAYRTKCGQLGLAEDAPTDASASARQRVSEELSLLQSVQRMAEGYALSGKLAAVEKERCKTRSQLEIAQKITAQIGTKRQALENAGCEIEGWIRLLSEHVNRAVTDRITAHKAEINSLFKAMIPAPYLFEEITMKQEGNDLRLGLRYRGQEEDVGEPQFFLSNAQANVLALSLFLSFTRAQRWAKLETILLDDPVQHLDDLDAVAFLDTLRSVALGGLGPRKQVVISTCDQNLYLLMIRKFGMLESMGLRFTGISLLDRGEAGPEIIYDIGGPLGKRYLREAA